MALPAGDSVTQRRLDGRLLRAALQLQGSFLNDTLQLEEGGGGWAAVAGEDGGEMDWLRARWGPALRGLVKVEARLQL